MEIGEVFWYVVLLLLFFGGSAAGLIQHLQTRHHKFKIDMAKEKTKLERARLELIQEQNRLTALDVRKAELEIESYDRRIVGLPKGLEGLK